MQSLTAWWQALPSIRALLKFTYALQNSAHAGVAGFREVNLAIHAANTLLLFALLQRRAATLPHSLGVAFCGAALFALAPVQTEAVTYLSGRSSSLAALPCLAAVLCFDLATAEPAAARTRCWLLASLPAWYALALTIKETTLVLPLALLLWQRTRDARTPLHLDVAARRAFWVCAALAALAIAAALALPTYRHLLHVSLQARSITSNLVTEARAVGFLSAELLRLAALHADPQLAIVSGNDPIGIAALAAWIGLATGAWRLRDRAPQLCFGILWYGLWLLPTNSLLPRLDVANDRQLYLALVGPAWLIAIALGRLSQRRNAMRGIATGIAAGMLLLFAYGTLARNSVYRTEISFWSDVLQRSPRNARAANNLGIAYALACRDADAARAFISSIQLGPADPRARINLELLRAGALTYHDASGCRLRSS